MYAIVFGGIVAFSALITYKRVRDIKEDEREYKEGLMKRIK